MLQKATDTHGFIVEQLNNVALAQIKAGQLRAAFRTVDRLVHMADKLELALISGHDSGHGADRGPVQTGFGSDDGPGCVARLS